MGNQVFVRKGTFKILSDEVQQTVFKIKEEMDEEEQAKNKKSNAE